MPQPFVETLEDEELYPSSDGKPMGETTYHVLSWVLLFEALEDITQDLLDVLVAANLFIYYEEGNSKARKAPDAMVVKGVPRGPRRSFRTWIEKAVPNVAFEVVSRKTKKEDLTVKPDVYARIGIMEYFLFDPEGKFLKSPLQGFRLNRGKYVPVKPAGDGSMLSKELNARMVPEGSMLRLIDLRTGEPMLTRRERAEQERQRADALEAELARLRKK